MSVSSRLEGKNMQKGLVIAVGLWYAVATTSGAEEPILIAHRGLMRHAPENTMPAFAACVERSIGFELETSRFLGKTRPPGIASGNRASTVC